MKVRSFPFFSRKFLASLILTLLVLWGANRYITATRLPTEKTPIQWYSPQNNDNLKFVTLRALKKARNSIYIRVYGLTDRDIIALLNKKAKQGLYVEVQTDKKASRKIKKHLSDKVHHQHINSKGIMHEKVIVIDDKWAWLGSTNLTTKSLVMHDNLLGGFYNPPLANYLHRSSPEKASSLHPFQQNNLSCFLLPKHGNILLEKIVATIQNAKHSLKVAMFTWTHPKLTEAIIEAHQRGVNVEVVLDRGAINSSSKHSFASLISAGIPCRVQRGTQLMHHKLLLVDGATLITGSTNWTKAAFTKNNESTLFIKQLRGPDQEFFNNIWLILWKEGALP